MKPLKIGETKILPGQQIVGMDAGGTLSGNTESTFSPIPGEYTIRVIRAAINGENRPVAMTLSKDGEEVAAKTAPVMVQNATGYGGFFRVDERPESFEKGWERFEKLLLSRVQSRKCGIVPTGWAVQTTARTYKVRLLLNGSDDIVGAEMSVY